VQASVALSSQVMRAKSTGAAQVYDRGFLLSEAKRNAVLTLAEVQAYGRDSFGDPDYVCLYGLEPAAWYARGVRVLGRTAVECTRDRLADLIGRDVAAIACSAGTSAGVLIVDPFAGSANTLHWIQRHLDADRGIGFELDESVCGLTRENLAIASPKIELVHGDYAAGLAALDVPNDCLVVVFIAPPWGSALSAAHGLDLRETTAGRRGHRRLSAGHPRAAPALRDANVRTARTGVTPGADGTLRLVDADHL
jgi:hypothetical protein